MLIKALLVEFAVLFPDVPGKTVIAFHDVDTGNALPIKQHPYRVNPVKLMHMRNDIDCMLQNGIIEPSKSQWSSPCVLVPNQMVPSIFVLILGKLIQLPRHHQLFINLLSTTS